MATSTGFKYNPTWGRASWQESCRASSGSRSHVPCTSRAVFSLSIWDLQRSLSIHGSCIEMTGCRSRGCRELLLRHWCSGPRHLQGIVYSRADVAHRGALARVQRNAPTWSQISVGRIPSRTIKEMRHAMSESEVCACTPAPLASGGFNQKAQLPYGLTIDHIKAAMQEFLDFLGFINTQLNSRGISRLESMLMPANFSSMVGEFMNANIPRYCNRLVKNTHHNGHPDLIPTGLFQGNASQHAGQGIEVKGPSQAGPERADGQSLPR